MMQPASVEHASGYLNTLDDIRARDRDMAIAG